MCAHFKQFFDIEEHDGIITYLDELYEKMDSNPTDKYMIRETIIHIEFLYNAAKEGCNE